MEEEDQTTTSELVRNEGDTWSRGLSNKSLSSLEDSSSLGYNSAEMAYVNLETKEQYHDPSVIDHYHSESECKMRDHYYIASECRMKTSGMSDQIVPDIAEEIDEEQVLMLDSDAQALKPSLSSGYGSESFTDKIWVQMTDELGNEYRLRKSRETTYRQLLNELKGIVKKWIIAGAKGYTITNEDTMQNLCEQRNDFLKKPMGGAHNFFVQYK